MIRWIMAFLDMIDGFEINIALKMKALYRRGDNALVRQRHGISKHRHSTQFLNSQLNSATSEISKLKSQLVEVQKDALFDSTTTLYNRRSFDRDLETLCEANQSLCLILLDIDHFKNFNDTYGRNGDMVLKVLLLA
ncbi:diguanylate cyclase [Vibrio chagasii]|nr:diguanylate cyclase [Vibrio chagasii]